ncbi:MAG: 5'-methylthioadenosine/adenosylhomocysteine nucleosidase [Desulfovibrionaceae bacterium]
MKVIYILILLCCIPFSVYSKISTDKGPIAIMGAMDIEIDLLQKIVANRATHMVGDMLFYTGILENKNVVIALSGIGKVNAAVAATILFEHFNAQEIIFTGVAGALDPSLHVGDIVIATDLIQHDVDLTVFGKKYGQFHGIDTWAIPSDAKRTVLLTTIAKNIHKTQRVCNGRILSGDQFISDKEKSVWLNTYFNNAKAVEMEGAAVAHVAYKYKKPFVIIRAISDSPFIENTESKEQYDTFAKNVAEISARIVRAYVKAL